MECASTLARSDFKVRRETGFFTIVCLSHAEYVASCAPRGIADHDETAGQQAITNGATLAVVLAQVLNLDRNALEDNGGVLEIQPAISQSACTLDWVEGDAHWLLYIQQPRCARLPAGCRNGTTHPHAT